MSGYHYQLRCQRLQQSGLRPCWQTVHRNQQTSLLLPVLLSLLTDPAPVHAVNVSAVGAAADG